jgi:hypothetical protein
MEKKQAVKQLVKHWAKALWRRLGPSPYKQTVLAWSLVQQ